MKIAELLDAVKEKTGAKSDGELARKLGVSKQAMSSYYSGVRAPDEFVCLKIAQALEKPLDTVIATVKVASEKDETRRSEWENYMKRLGGLAASFMMAFYVVVTLIVTSPDATAKESTGYDADSSVIQIMRLFRVLAEAVRRIGRVLFPRVYCADWIKSGITA